MAILCVSLLAQFPAGVQVDQRLHLTVAQHLARMPRAARCRAVAATGLVLVLGVLLDLLLTARDARPNQRDAQADESRPLEFSADVQPLLSRFCYDCHGADVQEGQVRLDHFAGYRLEDRAVWTKVYQKLAAGEMPRAMGRAPRTGGRRLPAGYEIRHSTYSFRASSRTTKHSRGEGPRLKFARGQKGKRAACASGRRGAGLRAGYARRRAAGGPAAGEAPARVR
jgi:hypothetical protein